DALSTRAAVPMWSLSTSAWMAATSEAKESIHAFIFSMCSEGFGMGGTLRRLRPRRQAPKTIVGRVLEDLAQRRVVEDGLDEVVDAPAEGHDRLAGVHELGRALADDVDAEQAPRLPLEDQLHHALGIVHDLPARVV